MYGDVFVIEKPGRPITRARKVPLGDTRGRNEAWLQELLFLHPDILPISDIDDRLDLCFRCAENCEPRRVLSISHSSMRQGV